MVGELSDTVTKINTYADSVSAYAQEQHSLQTA